MDLSKNIESLAAYGQNTPMNRAFSYSRISTAAQITGTGMARQAEAAVAYCKANNLRLDTSLKLEDHGLSAFKGDNLIRGKLGLFLKLVDAGKVPKNSTLLIESLDRTSRQNVLDAQELFLGIVNRGITLVTLMDGQRYNREEITSNPGKLFFSLAVMIRANEESETKSKRIKNAREKRRESAKGGKAVRKWTPPWCEWDESGAYVLDKNKAKLLRRIYQMYLDGMGPQTIAKTLNVEGVPSFARGTVNACKNDITEWYKTIVARTLVDKRLIGVAPFLDDKPDYFPKAVPDELFNRVQFRLSERARKPMPGQVGKGPVNIFAGIMRCGHCGGMMAKSRCVNSADYEYYYLVCENARSGKSSCKYRSVLMDTCEDSFLHLMTFRPWFEENLNETQGETVEERIEALKGELGETEKQIVKINNLILSDDAPPKSLVTRLKDLEKKADNLKAHVIVEEGKKADKQPKQDPHFFRNLPERMKAPVYRLKVRELLRTMIDRIEFFPRADFPHMHVYRPNGNIWSIAFTNVSRKQRNYEIHRGKVNVCTGWRDSETCQYEGDGMGVFGHLEY